jgi:hypothetical protein
MLQSLSCAPSIGRGTTPLASKNAQGLQQAIATSSGVARATSIVEPVISNGQPEL